MNIEIFMQHFICDENYIAKVLLELTILKHRQWCFLTPPVANPGHHLISDEEGEAGGMLTSLKNQDPCNSGW